jgi:hypothetical protein
MTDDMQDKCKLIAKWLDEYEERTVYPLGRTYSTQWYTECVRELDDGMIVEAEWPAYDKSDASAWRLLMAMPGQACFINGELWNVIHYDGERSYIRGKQGCTRKALVLAACQLIDEGVKPRGCA